MKYIENKIGLFIYLLFIYYFTCYIYIEQIFVVLAVLEQASLTERNLPLPPECWP